MIFMAIVFTWNGLDLQITLWLGCIMVLNINEINIFSYLISFNGLAVAACAECDGHSMFLFHAVCFLHAFQEVVCANQSLL